MSRMDQVDLGFPHDERGFPVVNDLDMIFDGTECHAVPRRDRHRRVLSRLVGVSRTCRQNDAREDRLTRDIRQQDARVGLGLLRVRANKNVVRDGSETNRGSVGNLLGHGGEGVGGCETLPEIAKQSRKKLAVEPLANSVQGGRDAALAEKFG